MASRVRRWRSGGIPRLDIPVLRQGLAFLKRSLHPAESADYRAWRQQFLHGRLRLCIWIAIPCFLTIAAHNFYLVFWNTAQFREDLTRFYRDSTIADPVMAAMVTSSVITGMLLVVCALLIRTTWARRHPGAVFLSLSWSLTLSDPIVGTFWGIPLVPDTFEFLAQATLIPVHWRLHFLSQLGPIAYYAVVYPILGLTKIGERSIYDSYAIGSINNLFWVCLICNLSVYLYEQLKRSEFESQRQLRVFLHSVSHDLKTPVMGTSIVLQSLLRKPDSAVQIDRSVLEQLLQGSDRQLTLINSLLEAHASEIQAPTLHREPLRLITVVKFVLSDLEPALTKNRVTVVNRVSPELPLVDADANQLWRVYSNLITNALKHNPHGITVTLDAEVIERGEWPHKPKRGKSSGTFKSQSAKPISYWLRATVQDNGVGIEPSQSHRLFELYARGSRARYMPGLGLGLYLCRQIIQAHGGEVGVVSTPGEGSTFWLTLPLSSH